MNPLARWFSRSGRVAGPCGQATEMDLSAMALALQLAQGAAGDGEVPVGAVVYLNDSGETLASSGNRRESDADPCGHAELIAIREACKTRGDWRLSDCTLVVTLEPCVMCAGAIVNARLGRVVYGAADPKAGACESLYRVLCDRRLNHRPQVIAGVCARECGDVLRSFFRDLRTQRSSRA